MPRNHPRYYHPWAVALAQLLTWLAGMLYRRQRDEWWADLLYAQKVEKQTGILQAAFWLVSAPGLGLRSGVVGAVIGTLRRPNEFANYILGVGEEPSTRMFQTPDPDSLFHPQAPMARALQRDVG